MRATSPERIPVHLYSPSHLRAGDQFTTASGVRHQVTAVETEPRLLVHARPVAAFTRWRSLALPLTQLPVDFDIVPGPGRASGLNNIATPWREYDGPEMEPERSVPLSAGLRAVYLSAPRLTTRGDPPRPGLYLHSTSGLIQLVVHGDWSRISRPQELALAGRLELGLNPRGTLLAAALAEKPLRRPWQLWTELVGAHLNPDGRFEPATTSALLAGVLPGWTQPLDSLTLVLDQLTAPAQTG